MISKISLRNFKVFKEKTEFNFSKINLLTGINGRGKSTLLQSLLLFKQSLEYSENTDKLILNGSCVELGKFDDVLNIDARRDDSIEISFSFEEKISKKSLSVSYEFIKNELDNLILDIRKCTIESNIDFHNYREGFSSKLIEIKKDDSGFTEYWSDVKKYFPLFNNILNRFAYQLFNREESEKDANTRVSSYFSLNRTHYVGADRIGSQMFYSNKQLPSFISVDKQGHNLATILSKKKEQIIHPKLRIEQQEYEGVKMISNGHTLETQLGNWIGYITDTNYCNIETDDTNDYIVSLNFSFDKETRNKFKPNNIGFGYSYVLPIIISGLIAVPGDMLIVENPEAHLHPKAQSRLARFLAKVAATGVQVFIESHSEHILNALRVCVKNKQLDPADINTLYFTNDKIVTPTIDEDGRIDLWEEGFFDEWNNNLMELL
jgi:predicted ATPase